MDFAQLGFYTHSGAQHMLALFSGAEQPLERLYATLSTVVPTPYMGSADLVEPGPRIETRNATDWAVAGGTIYNHRDLTWTSDTDWADIVGWAVLDSSELGRILWAGRVDPISALTGTVIDFPAGSIAFSISITDWALES
jgi:hypothetical protein